MRKWAQDQDMVGKQHRVNDAKSLVKKANAAREKREMDGRMASEWNVHDLTNDELMKEPTDVIPARMTRPFDTREGRLGQTEWAESRAALERAKDRGKNLREAAQEEDDNRRERRRQEEDDNRRKRRRQDINSES